ncbi:centromere protein B, putative [Ixodes scapularis]|uniref:Centromere protein B, putative n=1 Tax=Ixodes scapularis TaxID=6945 RepID=B7Q5K0_IXOSC|nr:centromere protein B, putative [Ixodes scapularis]|eukprot:XP_002411783.1 centromere protein B, putative [Ixodes scapularis]
MASRKRKPLNLREKLNILALVDRDPKRKIDIAKDLGLPASTVNTVVSKRKQIEENALVFGAATKQARGAKHGELEDAQQARPSGVNFDGSILWEKAMEITDIMAHPKDTLFLRNLRIVFLPANTTSHLQPLDAGIIKNVKHRKCIVRRFLARVSRGEDPGKLTLLDAMHYLNASWESVTSETVKNCFRKCGFRHSPEVEEPELSVSSDPDFCETEDDDMEEELRSAGAELAFSDFVAVDDEVPTCDPQTVADIVAELRQGQVTGDEHDDDEDEDEPETPPRATFAQAVAALDVLRSYFATKDNPAAEGGLQTLQKELFLPKNQGARQQKLKDVFGK